MASDDSQDTPRFTLSEEATLLSESNTLKAEANSLYASGDIQNALSRYDDALASCPNYLHFPRAVLLSNVAACHVREEQWAEAIKAATGSLDELVAIVAEARSRDSADGDKESDVREDEDDVEEELILTDVNATTAKTAPKKSPDTTTDPSAEDIFRIRTKALLRRARARSEAGGWQNLAGAEEDYRVLASGAPLEAPKPKEKPGKDDKSSSKDSKHDDDAKPEEPKPKPPPDMSGLAKLTPSDARTVRQQLRALPPRVKAAQEAEMAEMWGKLRTLGDGILKPFGLSTNNFQMVKDEKTGGYSMNFQQGAKE